RKRKELFLIKGAITQGVIGVIVEVQISF
ncbi:MAG: hypothetical protein ACJAVQ_002320, partial [Nonlabens sp.]